MRGVGFALLFSGALAAQLQERVETHENGATKARYSIDAFGRKNGPYVGYHPNGAVSVRATYHDDALDGGYQSFHSNGARYVSGGYFRGKLTGPYEEISEERDPDVDRLVDGGQAPRRLEADREQEARDDAEVARRRPRADQRIRAASGAGGGRARADGEDPRDPGARGGRERSEGRDAVCRAPAGAGDRFLCGVPWDGMLLDPGFNDLCDAASEVCEKLGYLTHTPTDPGGLPPGRFEKGRAGAGHSNISVGTDLPGSVDGYMDDSDPSNVARLGHRRWCLLPEMQKTGFGSSGRYAARCGREIAARPRSRD